MLTPRRLLLGLVGILVLAVVWTVWTAWQTERDLRNADAAINRLQSAIEVGDDAGRDDAVEDLQESASSAAGRTTGFWWGAMTKLPIYGDDAAGVQALSRSVDVLANSAVGPLLRTADSLEGIVSSGRIDVDRVESLRTPVAGAADAMRVAVELVERQDSARFVSALRTRFDDYERRLVQVAAEFRSARTALDVLPSMLGVAGPRDYLFIFQNNAEIRSTGGIAGSWARLHVDDGRLQLREQGSASDFVVQEPVTRLTAEEVAVYDQLPALFFQDPNFIPDFPRTAQIYDAFWRQRYPSIRLDGVMALDPIAISYLMAGTGPITADGLTLTSESIVQELLNGTYLTIADPRQQDRRFREVAQAVFKALTERLDSPVDFVRGIARATDEGRFLLAPFNQSEATRLAGTTVTGELTANEGVTPHVDLGLNDATGSKMSYYLRYTGRIEALACADGVQQLKGTVIFNQTISPREAMDLPDYVTGGGNFGIPIGSQLVTIRIYGPFGGAITNVRIDGKPLDVEEGLEIRGRPVVTAAPILDTTGDVLLTWDMSTGPGQTADGEVGITPSIVPGDSDRRFASAC